MPWSGQPDPMKAETHPDCLFRGNRSCDPWRCVHQGHTSELSFIAVNLTQLACRTEVRPTNQDLQVAISSGNSWDNNLLNKLFNYDTPH